MSLRYLEISHLRNLDKAILQPASQLNIISGDNAAGKTSLLEAIYFLSVARSFRSNHVKDVVQQDQPHLQVIGRVADSQDNEHILGIEKGSNHSRIRIDGENVQQASKLAYFLPVQLIHPEGHALLEQGPKQRRKFLDWGVFHVEPKFLPLWQQYSRLLKQRNAAIRQHQGKKAVALWDKPLAEYGEQITALRTSYLTHLSPYIKKYCDLLLGASVSVNFRRGWSKDQSFSEALTSQLDSDLKQGYSHAGPHRAEIEFYSDDHLVQNYFSRGQQKLLISALRLAQIDYLKQANNKSTVLLLDDLAAELDVTHRACLISAAIATGAQLFVTVTEQALISVPENSDLKMFHVEHGRVQPIMV